MAVVLLSCCISFFKCPMPLLSQDITVFGSVTWKLASEQWKLTLSRTTNLRWAKFSNISFIRAHKANQRCWVSWLRRWSRERMWGGMTGWQCWQSQGIFPLGWFLMPMCSLLPSLLHQWLSCWTSICQNTSSCSALPVNEQVAVITGCQFQAHAKEQARGNMTYLFCITPTHYRN